MRRRIEDGGWSPYLAGALVGVLAIISAYATTTWTGKTHYLGASTTFVRAAGLVERQVDAPYVEQNVYFAKTQVRVDWQFMMVVGIFLGAFLEGAFWSIRSEACRGGLCRWSAGLIWGAHG